jgi:hypothetical protein
LSAEGEIRIQFTAEDARSVLKPTVLDVVDRTTGELIERVTLLRYAGHYRTGSVHAFAIKDAEGKFRVRGEASLGLTDDSPNVAYLSSESSIVAA